MTFIKDVSANNDAGTASKWGGNDIMFVDKLFDDIDIAPKFPKVNTDFRFRDLRLWLRNPANTFDYKIKTSAITGNRQVTLPVVSADCNFILDGADNNLGDHYLDIGDIAAPANPSAGVRRIFLDSGTGELSVRTSSGTTVSLESGNAAPVGAQYLVLAADATLTLERIITAGENVKFTDAGAGSTYTIDVAKEAFNLEGVISPSQITSNQNNYNPTNLATSSIIRLDADSSFRIITGITAPSPEKNKVLILRNVSANSILLANQNTNSTAANRFEFSGYDLPLFPKSQIILTYDTTNDRWYCENPHAYVQPPLKQGFFVSRYMVGNATDNFLYTVTAASGGTITNPTVTAGNPSVLTITSGTSASGTASIGKPFSTIMLLGNSWYWYFECDVFFDALSNGTTRYTARIGFIDSGTAEPTDGVYFRYVDNVNSGKWVFVTRSNGTETANNYAGTAVAATTWYRLKIVVDPAGNVEFFENGVSLQTQNTNVPTGAGRGTGYGLALVKSAGTSDGNIVSLNNMEIAGYSNVDMRD